MKKLDVAGPYEIPTHYPPRGGRRIIGDFHSRGGIKKSEFTILINQEILNWGKYDITSSVGLYIFSLKSSRGFTPYYVGKTTKQGLIFEAFNPSNCLKYNDCIAHYKGTPVMFFVLPQPIRGKPNLKIITEVEMFLIGAAYQKIGKWIYNKQHAKDHSWGINGVVRPGKGTTTKASKQFKSMMGL